VNPSGNEKGLLMLYNPLNVPINRNIQVPVYYTGLNSKTQVEDVDGKLKTALINREYEITLNVTIPAKGFTYYILK
jgi:hypothetical protein